MFACSLRGARFRISRRVVAGEYTLTFSESFNVIMTGLSKQYAADGTLRSTKRFPDQLVYWRQLPAAISILGQTYIQGARIGVASYHFPAGTAPVDVSNDDELPAGSSSAPAADQPAEPPAEDAAAAAAAVSTPTGAYISYEHAPASWTLDDGSRPPARKFFLNPTFDAATRTFTATIEWGPTTFGGDGRWDYTMVFDEGFDAIVGGQVRAFKADGTEKAPIIFGQHLVYERHDPARAELIALLHAS